MGQPTQRATNYTATSNIDTAQIFLHANGQRPKRAMIRQRSRRRQRRGEPHTEHGLGVLLACVLCIGCNGIARPPSRIAVTNVECCKLLEGPALISRVLPLHRATYIRPDNAHRHTYAFGVYNGIACPPSRIARVSTRASQSVEETSARLSS